MSGLPFGSLFIVHKKDTVNLVKIKVKRLE